MKTQDLNNLLGTTSGNGSEMDKVVEQLMVSDIRGIPVWDDLLKEYNPMEHDIIKDTTKYPPSRTKTGADKLPRIPIGLQKLTTKRLAQAMFSQPVTRNYIYGIEKNDTTAIATKCLETLIVGSGLNNINIERAKALNASCQVVTVWRVIPTPKPYKLMGKDVKFKLKAEHYSPLQGNKLYPQLDENGLMNCVSIQSEVKTTDDTITYLDTYTDTKYIRFVKNGEHWTVDITKELSFQPCTFIYKTEPGWGGKENTILVDSIESLVSKNAFYIDENAKPNFSVYRGEGKTAKSTKVEGEDSTGQPQSEARGVYELGKDGFVKEITWEGANAATESQYKNLRNSFFEQTQIPDISFSNLMASHTSADNKEIMFTDVKAKALDEAGEWEAMFMEENDIIKKFASTILPDFAPIYDSTLIETKINPYAVNSKKEIAEYVAGAGSAMSLRTKITLLNEAEDVDEEIQAIKEDQSFDSNNI